MQLHPVHRGTTAHSTRGTGAPGAPAPVDQVVASQSEDSGLIPKPGFFGSEATSQLTATGSFVHRGAVPPQLTPGPGDEAYFAAGGKLYRMEPTGQTTELGQEGSLNLSQPLLAGGQSLIYRTDEGHLVARQLDGQELWRQPIGGLSYYPVGLSADGQALFTVNIAADGRQSVSVRSPATGQEQFPLSLAPGEEVVGMVDGRTLLVAGIGEKSEQYLQLVRPDERGRKVEGLDVPEHGRAAWLGQDGQVFVRDSLGRLSAHEAATLHQNWRHNGPVKDVFLSPDGSLLAVFGKTLTRLSAEGDVAWSCQAPAPVLEGSFDGKGNFYTNTGGQLSFLPPSGEIESTPWKGAVRASGSGMLYQVLSPEPPPTLAGQGNLALGLAGGALGALGGALKGLLSRKGLKETARSVAQGASQGYGSLYQPGNPTPPGPNRLIEDHRVEAVRFLSKKELLASVQSTLQGPAPGIDEQAGRVIVGGVPVRTRPG
ncbi:MAG: hypothetical protein AMXMBFR33_59460 [Candidatus Xenobia bacterium]